MLAGRRMGLFMVAFSLSANNIGGGSTTGLAQKAYGEWGMSAIWYVLVFGKLGFPALGIAGAAIGSSLAELVSMLFFIIYTTQKRSILDKIGMSYFFCHIRRIPKCPTFV